MTFLPTVGCPRRVWPPANSLTQPGYRSRYYRGSRCACRIGDGRRNRILAFVLQAAGPVVRQLHHMSFAERLWKYAALGATSIIGEEANPILGGIAVRHGGAGLFGVIVAVMLGTWAASILFYFIGRWRIDWVRARWPDKRRLLTGALMIVRRHPWRASLAVRFAYGLRLPLPIACGAARLPFSLYLMASGISSLVWAVSFSLLGLALGRTALRALMFTQRLDVRLGLLAVVLIVVLTLVVRRRWIAERTAEVLAGEEISLTEMEEREVVES
jgi:membrane protein DedA with SNARE-associated domain